MDDVEAHQRGQEVFAGVLVTVTPAQLSLPSPCADWDVRGVIDHVLGGNQLVQKRAGRTPPALPEDLVAAHALSARGAQETFAAPDGLTRMFELPFGPVSGARFIGFRTIDLLIHAWDIAKATGQSTDLDHELCDYARPAAEERMGPHFRGEGRPFGPEQPCPPDCSPADRLAAYLGRAVG
jgi:uncharacterized protein (TIGR03086 family)